MTYDSATRPTSASLTVAVHMLGRVGCDSNATPVVATAAPTMAATIVLNMLVFLSFDSFTLASIIVAVRYACTGTTSFPVRRNDTVIIRRSFCYWC